MTSNVTKAALSLTTIMAMAGFSPSAKADEWNKRTVLTFSAQVEVPGTVLPAGKYVFELADNDSIRDIVQIFTVDEKRLLATILAIPAYRLEASPETMITFEERPAGSPEAIHTWFYPGDTSGIEFVYPRVAKSNATEASRQAVVAAAATSEVPSPPELNTQLRRIDQDPFVVVTIPPPDPEAEGETAGSETPEAAEGAAEAIPERASGEAARETTDEATEKTEKNAPVSLTEGIPDTLPATAGNFLIFPLLGIGLLSGGGALLLLGRKTR